MPPPPDVCVATDPCGPNSQCIVVRQTKKRAQPYLCKCNQGFKGDPYSSGPDKCRDEQQLYLEELFGMNRCYGCKYEPAIYGTYESVNITRVLDVGTGACGVVRKFIQHGLQPSGVEAVSFPLEDRCADLMQAGIVQKAALDALPFPDAEFQLVTAFNTLEYIPRDKLDSVLAELVRVAQMRVFITVQLPDMDADEMLGPEDIKPESFFPRLWWIERLEAHGLSVVPTRMSMYAMQYSAMSKKKKLGPTDGVFVLNKLPESGSSAAKSGERMQCVGCSYMPLAYSIYAPIRPNTGFTMQSTLVVGPSACNLVRGMDMNPPLGLSRLSGLARDEYIVEMGCPELQDQGKVTFTRVDEEVLPYPSADFDLVISMYDLEYMSEGHLPFAIQELARVTTNRVFLTVHTCGNKFEVPHCAASRIKEIQILHSRDWWLTQLYENGLREEYVTRVFGRRECEEGMTVAAGGFRVSKEAELLRTGTAKEINAYMKANPGFKPFEQGKNHRNKNCQSVFEELRASSKHQLMQDNVFILKRFEPQTAKQIKSPPKPPLPPKHIGGATGKAKVHAVTTADELSEEAAGEVFGWEDAPPSARTGKGHATGGVSPPPPISEEELESQLEEELKALDNENVDQVDPQTGEKVSQQSEWSAKYMLSPPPKPRTLVDAYKEAGYNINGAKQGPKSPSTKPNRKAAAFHYNTPELHKLNLQETHAALKDRISESARMRYQEEMIAKDPTHAAAEQHRLRQYRAGVIKEFEDKHGITTEEIVKKQTEFHKQIEKEMEDRANNIHITSSRLPGDHKDPNLHLHKNPETGKWERQVTLNSLARKHAEHLPDHWKRSGAEVKSDRATSKASLYSSADAAADLPKHHPEYDPHGENMHLPDMSLEALEKEFGKLDTKFKG